MSTVIVLFVVGYIFHLLYKLVDIGFVFISNLVQKFKKTKAGSLKKAKGDV